MTVGIVGMGYVGLPLAVAFASAGQRVIAMDSDPRKVAALEARESYIEDIPSAELEAMGDLLEPTTRVGPLGHADAVLLCVPTPLTANREPDLGPLLDATQALARVLRAGSTSRPSSSSSPARSTCTCPTTAWRRSSAPSTTWARRSRARGWPCSASPTRRGSAICASRRR